MGTAAFTKVRESCWAVGRSVEPSRMEGAEGMLLVLAVGGGSVASCLLFFLLLYGRFLLLVAPLLVLDDRAPFREAAAISRTMLLAKIARS